MSSDFPRWLTEQVKFKRPFPALIAEGMSLLVESALPGGIGQRVKTGEGGDGVRVWTAGLESRLLNLPARLGVGQGDLAASHKRFATLIARRLLQPGPNMPVLPMESPTASDVSAYVETVLSSLKRLARTSAGESRRAAAVTQETRPHRTPFVLLQASYQALAANRRHVGASESDAHALALFGMAGFSLLTMQGCEMCFRWAMIGHRYCAEHSLSAEASGSRLERQARHQSGRRAMVEFHYRLKELPRRFTEGASARQRAFMVSRVLWGTQVPGEDTVASKVAAFLTAYPRTFAHVTKGEQPQSQPLFEKLRERLDPLEFVPGNWRTKIRAAETWFRAVERRTPGARRGGRKSRLRIIDAFFLVRDFGASKSEIADQLGLHPSTISHWLRHRADEPTVKELAAQLAANRERMLARRKKRQRRLARKKRLGLLQSTGSEMPNA